MAVSEFNGARRLGGYTLIELLVVLALMGLLLAVVPARIDLGAAAELKAASRSVAAGLRQARTIAIGQRVETVFQLDLSEKKFRVGGETKEHSLPKDIDLKLLTGQQEILSERVGNIRFYPDGGATGGRITLAAAGQSYAVDIDWMTGKVTIGD